MDGLVQQALQDHLLNAAKAVEDQLDTQLHAMDNMDEEGLESLRQHRIDQMKLQAQRRQQWAAKGHGEYREVLSEKEFFSEMKSEARMVCHFFRNNWPCKVQRTVMPDPLCTALQGQAQRYCCTSGSLTLS